MTAKEIAGKPAPWSVDTSSIRAELEDLAKFAAAENIPVFLTIVTGFDGEQETRAVLCVIPPLVKIPGEFLFQLLVARALFAPRDDLPEEAAEFILSRPMAEAVVMLEGQRKTTGFICDADWTADRDQYHARLEKIRLWSIENNCPMLSIAATSYDQDSGLKITTCFIRPETCLNRIPIKLEVYDRYRYLLSKLLSTPQGRHELGLGLMLAVSPAEHILADFQQRVIQERIEKLGCLSPPDEDEKTDENPCMN